MTWFTTWPSGGRTAYEPHDTEQQAEAHAHELVRSGRARVATVFRNEQTEESSK